MEHVSVVASLCYTRINVESIWLGLFKSYFCLPNAKSISITTGLLLPLYVAISIL